MSLSSLAIDRQTCRPLQVIPTHRQARGKLAPGRGAIAQASESLTWRCRHRGGWWCSSHWGVAVLSYIRRTPRSISPCQGTCDAQLGGLRAELPSATAAAAAAAWCAPEEAVRCGRPDRGLLAARRVQVLHTCLLQTMRPCPLLLGVGASWTRVSSRLASDQSVDAVSGRAASDVHCQWACLLACVNK